MKRYLPFAALVAAGAISTAHADPIALFDGTVTADAGAAAPVGFDPALGNANGGNGGGLLTGDILVTAPSDGFLTIALADLGTTLSGRKGSVYEVLLDAGELGLTSATATDAASFSTGTFSTFVTQGSHDLGVYDFIATFAGYPTASPYGGTVDPEFSQANVSVDVQFDVPEPGSLAVSGAALIALSPASRRKRRPAGR